MSTANSLIGTPYRWGGTSPSGFDCSGFMSYVFNKAGVSLPRTTIDQYKAGTFVSKTDLQPGDAVFFKNTYRQGISHAGIYVGDNHFIHASSSGVVKTSLNNPYWSPKYHGAKRYIKPVAVKPVAKPVETKPAETQPVTTKPQSAEEQIIDTQIELTTLKGSTRETTAVEISKEIYPNGFDPKHQYKTVIVATAYEFADALSAAPLAAKYDNAPILLTEANKLNSNVATEIRRLKAEKVIVLGGEQAVSTQALQEAEQIVGKGNVSRISGSTRYETNEKINNQVGEVEGYFVVSGQEPADALSAAPIAAQNNWAIVLTNKNNINSETIEALEGKKISVLGGEAAISNQVYNQLEVEAATINRLSGKNRYETLSAVLNEFETNMDKIYMATGKNFPDALSAASLVNATDGTLLLIGDSVDNSLDQYITSSNPNNLYIIGGVVSNKAINSFLRLAN
nr:cell wall-binding repeat-containing protein [Bacillus suaedae]